MTDKPLVMYGIWIRGRGWWKVTVNNKISAFADTNRETVQYYAAWISGKVMPIDASLEANEEQLLLAEQRHLSQKARYLWQNLFLQKK